MRRIAEYEGAPYGQDYAICTLWMGIIDATISAQTLVLAAEAEGLRSCYNGNVVDNADEVSELLNLPEHVIPAFMLTLGYPRSNGQRSRKYPYDVIVHHETYKDMSMEKLYPHHIEKCGKPHFAANAARCAQLQYWFGCYYPSNEDTAMTAEGYRKFLRNKGLDLDENGMR